MFMTNSIRTACASMGGHAAGPARRRFGAVVAMAAMIACGLPAAPLLADHEKFEVAVTLEAEAGDRQVTLRASYTDSGNAGGAAAGEIIGFRFREQVDGVWDDSWWNMNDDGTSTIGDLTNGTAYTYEAQAYKVRRVDGAWHYAFSDSSNAVTATPAAAAQ